MNDKPEKNKAEEPAVEYKKNKTFRFFKSFEEEAEANYEFYRNLTHLERLEILYKLNCRFFPAIKHHSNRFRF